MTEMDVFFMYMATNIHRVKETEQNIAIFMHNLQRNKEELPFYAAVTISDDNLVHYQNMTSMLAWHDKRIFLSILLEEIPSLLWQRVFHQDDLTVNLTTPIDAAIHSRDPLLVEHILNLSLMKKYKETNPVEYSSLISNGYNNAMTWFYMNGTSSLADNEKQIMAMLIMS